MNANYIVRTHFPEVHGPRDYYHIRKIDLQDEAIRFQESFFAGKAWSYAELAEKQSYFEREGRKYGLLQEFRKNGIC